MLPNKFLKNNCIKNPADINRVLYYLDSSGTLKQLEDWKKSDPEVCIIL